jgi:hypothetical protein
MHTGTGTYLQIFPPLFYTKYLYYSLVDFESNSGVPGLARAIESKYNVSATAIRYLYRRNRKGITAKLDDDLLKYYCNEDTFLMQVCYGTYPVLRSAEPKIFISALAPGSRISELPGMVPDPDLSPT